MGVKRTQEGEEDLHILLPDNPFVPAKDGTCLINKLPPELLSRIFEAGLAEDENGDEDNSADLSDAEDVHGDSHGVQLDTELEGDDEKGDQETHSETASSCDHCSSWPEFPNLVSHVCRHWRNVALSTPSLWTTIMVISESRPPYEPQSTQLERSKGLELDIYIDLDSPAVSPTHNIEFLYSMLVDHIHRWRTMEVSVMHYDDIYAFLHAVSSSIPIAPQLTTLALYHHGNDSPRSAASEHLTLFGGSAPSLTSLVLWGVHVDWDQSWIASASNLKVLELAYHQEEYCPSWTQFSTILRNASTLEKLNLIMSRPTEDPKKWIIEPTLGGPTDLNGPIQFHRLSELVLAFLSPACAGGLLRKFYLPILKRLVLDFDDGDFTDFVHALAGPVPSFYTSQERSHSLLSRLEYLKIAGLPCRPECLRTLYGELKNLTTLSISLHYLPEDFLDILGEPCSLPGQGDVWLPRLETLYVSGTYGDFLRDVVERRGEAGAPPISLYVEESCGLDDDDVEWLKKNVKRLEFFEESDDEDDEDDVIDLDLDEDEDVDADEWSDVDDNSLD